MEKQYDVIFADYKFKDGYNSQTITIPSKTFGKSEMRYTPIMPDNHESVNIDCSCRACCCANGHCTHSEDL